ncbi:hypothetical protein A8P48_02945 [Yersinia pestis]|nr:hypothetical protein A8P48_02945 [Yersinia pestis]
MNDSLMWVATSADQTLAKGNSMVVVSTQMAMVDQIFVTTLNDGSLPFDPVITNSRYEDTSYEMLWGMKNEAKGWDTKATSHDSVFVDASKQSIEANGHSIGATFMVGPLRWSKLAVSHRIPTYLITVIPGYMPRLN